MKYLFISKNPFFGNFPLLNINIIKVWTDFYMLILVMTFLEVFSHCCLCIANLWNFFIFRSRKWHFFKKYCQKINWHSRERHPPLNVFKDDRITLQSRKLSVPQFLPKKICIDLSEKLTLSSVGEWNLEFQAFFFLMFHMHPREIIFKTLD